MNATVRYAASGSFLRRQPAVHREPLPQRWSERLRLDDGRELLLRPIDAADAEPIRNAFALLSPDEVRMRFLHPIKELTPQMLRRLTQIDTRTEFALVIAEPLPPGEALVGAVGRVAIEPGTRRGEFAILVSRFIANRGLGRLLMRKLVSWAKRKRLDELYGDVLDENSAMLALADALGFRRELVPDDPGIVRVRLALRSRT